MRLLTSNLFRELEIKYEDHTLANSTAAIINDRVVTLGEAGVELLRLFGYDVKPGKIKTGTDAIVLIDGCWKFSEIKIDFMASKTGNLFIETVYKDKQSKHLQDSNDVMFYIYRDKETRNVDNIWFPYDVIESHFKDYPTRPANGGLTEGKVIPLSACKAVSRVRVRGRHLPFGGNLMEPIKWVMSSRKRAIVARK